ncbi:unnamed protein product, partial [Medioppia subpectinata]
SARRPKERSIKLININLRANQMGQNIAHIVLIPATMAAIGGHKNLGAICVHFCATKRRQRLHNTGPDICETTASGRYGCHQCSVSHFAPAILPDTSNTNTALSDIVYDLMYKYNKYQAIVSVVGPHFEGNTFTANLILNYLEKQNNDLDKWPSDVTLTPNHGFKNIEIDPDENGQKGLKCPGIEIWSEPLIVDRNNRRVAQYPDVSGEKYVIQVKLYEQFLNTLSQWECSNYEEMEANFKLITEKADNYQTLGRDFNKKGSYLVACPTYKVKNTNWKVGELCPEYVNQMKTFIQLDALDTLALDHNMKGITFTNTDQLLKMIETQIIMFNNLNINRPVLESSLDNIDDTDSNTPDKPSSDQAQSTSNSNHNGHSNGPQTEPGDLPEQPLPIEVYQQKSAQIISQLSDEPMPDSPPPDVGRADDPDESSSENMDTLNHDQITNDSDSSYDNIISEAPFSMGSELMTSDNDSGGDDTGNESPGHSSSKQSQLSSTHLPMINNVGNNSAHINRVIVREWEIRRTSRQTSTDPLGNRHPLADNEGKGSADERTVGDTTGAVDKNENFPQKFTKSSGNHSTPH